MRNVGMHAGGVVIAPGKLTDFARCTRRGSGSVVTQFDKDDVEAVGPGEVRLPRPAPRSRSSTGRERFIARASRASRASRSTSCRWTTRRPTSCSPSGKTTAVFQLESRGMQDLIKRAQPDRFEDIIALVALFRPGPMDLIPRLHRAQARPTARRLSRSAPRADPRPDLRHHGVPGAGDADRAGARRLLARRRRPAAPRDGQEEARGDGEAARRSSSTARRRTACREDKADAASST